MIYKFTHAAQLRVSKSPLRYLGKAVRGWLCLWVLLLGILPPMIAQETILEISFDGNSGFELEEFPVIEQVVDGLENFIAPGILRGDGDGNTVIRRGPGLSDSGNGLTETFAPNSFFACDFESSESLVEDDYFEVVFYFEEGVSVNLTEFNFYLARTALTGPENMAVRSSVTGDTLLLEDDANATSTLYTVDLSTRSAFRNLTDSVAFRIYGWDGADDLTIFGTPIVSGANRCMRIENGDEEGFDIELLGCINFPVLPDFNLDLANNDTICSGDLISIDLLASDSAGVEGEDFQFVLEDVLVDLAVGGTDTIGYGALLGGNLSAEAILEGDSAIFETLINPTDSIITVTFRVKTTKIGDGFDLCQGETFDINLSILPLPILALTGDAVDSLVCGDVTDGTVDLSAFVADTSLGLVANAFLFFDDEWQLIDSTQTIINGVPQFEGDEVVVEAGVFNIVGINTLLGCADTVSLEVALFPERPDINFLSVEAAFDTLCSGDTLSVTFDLPESLEGLLNEGDFEFLVRSIRNDTLPPFNEIEGAVNGLGDILLDSLISIGDTVTGGIEVVLNNPTDEAVRLTFFIETRLTDSPDCQANPAAGVSVVILPELSETDVFFTVNGDTLLDNDIQVCIGDTIITNILNNGPANMLAQYIINDTLDIFDIENLLQVDGVLPLPFISDINTTNGLTQEHFSNEPILTQFNTAMIAANAGQQFIQIALFVDANGNEILDPGELNCPGDTITLSIEVINLPELDLIVDNLEGIICGNEVDGTVVLSNIVADSSENQIADAFVFFDSEFNVLDSALSVVAGVPQSEGLEDTVGAGTYFIVGLNTALGCADTLEVEVALFPGRPGITYNNPAGILDTICSGELLDVDFSLPANLNTLIEGDFEFIVELIRNDTLPPFNQGNGASAGLGDIILDTVIVEGDTVTDGIQAILTNPTDEPIRLSFFVGTQVAETPFCSGPLRQVSVVVLPEPSASEAFFIVNGDTLLDTDIQVCIGDTIITNILNNGPTNLLAQFVIDDTTDIFDVTIADSYDGILTLPFDGLLTELTEDEADIVQFESELIAAEIGLRTIQIATFLDVDGDSVLDAFELACPSDTIELSIEVLGLPELVLLGDNIEGLVCGNETDGTVVLSNLVADTSANLLADVFLFFDSEFNLLDSALTVDAGIPQSEGLEDTVGAGTFFIVGLNSVLGCADTLQVEVALFPGRPGITYNNPEGVLDTICSGELLDVDFSLPVNLDSLVEGDFEFVIDQIRNDTLPPFNQGNGASAGLGDIIPGVEIAVGDTVTDGIQLALNNPTDEPIRLTLLVGTQLSESPLCSGPLRQVSVVILPEVSETNVFFTVNGDSISDTDIKVCIGDTVQTSIVNSGTANLLAQFVIEDTTDIFEVTISDIYSGILTLPFESLLTELTEDEANIVQFESELIAAEVGLRTIQIATFLDVDGDSVLDAFELACPGDTINLSIEVLAQPNLVAVGRDTVCSEEAYEIEIMTEDTSLVEGEDYALVVTSVRNDEDEDPFSNPLSPGQGYGPLMIAAGDSIKIGDTITSPISQTLINPTGQVVRMRYRVKAVSLTETMCESPAVNYEVMVWPAVGEFNLSWKIGDEIVDQDTITVCEGDTISKFFVNLSGSTDIILRKVTDVATFDMALAAGDSLMGAPTIASMEMNGTQKYVAYPDANKDGQLDDQEMKCVGDTLTCFVIVVDAPVITMQPTPEQDTVCEMEELMYEVSVDNESGVWEGIWQFKAADSAAFDNFMGMTDTMLTVIVDDMELYDGGMFRYCAFNACDTVYSDPVEILLRPSPIFTNMPEDFTACEGEEVEITVSATQADTLICQIEQNGVFVTDKSFNAIEPKAIEKEFLITIDSTTRLRFIAANACLRDTSDLVITVPDSVKITMNPDSVATCEGDSVSFIVGVEAENGGMWQYRDEAEWINAGIMDTILTYTDVMGEMDGREIRYCAFNECDTVYSEVVVLAVDTACEISIIDPCNCLANESAPGAGDGQFSETFTIFAPAGLTFVIGAGSEELFDAMSEDPPADPIMLNVGDTIPETAPGEYTLPIRALNGVEYTLNVAINDTNNVLADLSVTKTCSYDTPIVSLQPADTLICVGDTAIFTTMVQFADSVSFQVMAMGDTGFTEIEGMGGLGATDSMIMETYSINQVMVDMDSAMYRVVAFNCGTAISDTVVLRVLNVNAGTLIPATITCMDTTLDLFAIAGDAPVAPAGFDTLYVLTSTDSLIIEDTNTEPFFTVSDTGIFRIHTLVAEINDMNSDDFLDLNVVIPGVTLAGEVLELIAANNICADLDPAGALFEVERCNTIGGCDEVTITCEIFDWDEDDNGADPYNHGFYFFESLINGHKGDDSLANRFTIDGTGQLIIKNDTARVMATATSKLDTTAKIDVMMVLTHPKNWMEFSNGGGTWLAQRPEALAVAETEFPNWTYWIVDTTSRVIGMGSLSGTFLNLTHAPADSSKAVQQGIGANDKDGDLGLAGWFFYEGDVVYNGDTTFFKSQGDINSDIGACDTICDLPIVGPIVSNFTVQAVSNDAVQVSWGTLTEGNGGYVVVERSIDGQIYEQVTVLEGNNAAFNAENHVFTDVQDGANGTYFYRMKAVKPDGTYAYTNVVQVTLDGLAKNTYLVYPNPAENGSFTIRVISPKTGTHYYEVYDLDGRRLLRDELNVYGTQVDVNRLTSGMYFLRIIDPEGEEYSQRMAVRP